MILRFSSTSYPVLMMASTMCHLVLLAYGIVCFTVQHLINNLPTTVLWKAWQRGITPPPVGFCVTVTAGSKTPVRAYTHLCWSGCVQCGARPPPSCQSCAGLQIYSIRHSSSCACNNICGRPSCKLPCQAQHTATDLVACGSSLCLMQ